MIERAGKKKMLIFSGSSNPELAIKVPKDQELKLAKVNRTHFEKEEFIIRLQ